MNEHEGFETSRMVYDGGRVRYIGNKVIQYIFVEYKVDLEKIAQLTQRGVLPLTDVKQFYRLLGYSLDAYNELFDNDE